MKLIEVPVKGGMLRLTDDHSGKLAFEYTGAISRDFALDLLAATPDSESFTINGQRLGDWLRGLRWT